MKKHGPLVVVGLASILAGCGGGGASESATSVRQADEGGAMGRTRYGAIHDALVPETTTRSSQTYGYDVSSYQGTVNYAQLKTVASFVVIRATYGKTSVDTNFSTNRANAEAQGMEVGFYHYSYPQLNSATDEANHFADTVGTLKSGEFIALDFEESYSGDVVGWCKTWLDTVYSRTGVRPLLYVNLSTANGYTWSPVINANYGLWLARYDYDKTAAAPTTQWSFTAMRQYSDQETASGISGNVDGDTFYGTLATLKKYGHA